MKEFYTDCVNWEGNTSELSDLIDNAEDIKHEEFFRACEVPIDVIVSFTEYPDDFEFYRNEEIYFYVHSAIEYFYK